MCSEGPAAAHAKAGPTEIVWMKSKEINQASPPTHYISICHYLSVIIYLITYRSIDRSSIDRSIGSLWWVPLSRLTSMGTSLESRKLDTSSASDSSCEPHRQRARDVLVILIVAPSLKYHMLFVPIEMKASKHRWRPPPH